MKKLFTYTVLLSGLSAALFSCTKQEEWEPTGNRLEIKAELVSSSEWTTRAADERVEYGHWAEMGGGEYIITAQKEDWNAHRPAPEAPEAPDAPASTAPEAPDAPLTRGTPITSVSGITKMQVNIFQTASVDWTTSSLRTAALTATRSGTGYTVSPSYNWPMDASAKTSLFAYSPQTSSSNGLSENGANKINYTVPTAVANQPDLCTAAPKMNVVNSDGTQQIQSFALSHQLTAVGFTMLGWKLKITKITVSGVNTVGTLTMNTNGTTSWASSSPGSRDVGVTQNSYTHNHDSNYADITTSNGYLMMIPQTLSDAATVTITYASTGTGADSGTVTAKLKDLGVTWEAGDKITYNIRLKTAPAVTSGDMTITTSLAGYTTSSPLTMHTDKTDKITFKWSESWLKIHMGNPIYGNPSPGNGVAGQWTTPGGPISNIYFFATNDNTSTGPRTAIITASGTRSGTKTFNVIQAKTLKPIELNGLLWAPGNLVASGANSCKIGEPGDNGLYFQYGGLIGYKGGKNGDGVGIISESKNYNYWSNGAQSYSANEVAVKPAAYTKQDTWPYFDNYASIQWGYYSTNLFFTRYADFQGRNDANDPAKGIGDPCAYYLGSPWRLPKYNELSAITGITTEGYWETWNTAGITGRWVDIGPQSSRGAWFGPNSRSGTPTVNTDLFIPASGYRKYGNGAFDSIDSWGYLWSSSVNDTTRGFYLSIQKFSGVAPRNWGDRALAYPVRCVRNK